MKCLLQRVLSCTVSVDDKAVGHIDAGVLALLAVENGDTPKLAERMVERVLNYRLFADANGRLDQSLLQTGGGLMLVSQFTLAAHTHKGLRPSFTPAAAPDQAEPIYDHALAHARSLHQDVASGRFGAYMQVALVNDGPLTFMLELK